ncbi:hypothetical protein [Legionella spiritensis]|uniref:Glycine-rich protein n=1 Tax=Legionella spiritensis TaxID=452 RepID=A0A0W0Z6J1_LEGSP|nr:hypothetical protein [Legionella spiritensis]KTD64527.1 hypothetical protein Lspi_1334 [Legionella spiritensis]SNV29939.1 Uncharacterised protein [Legionella spiritensis]VEG91837.1 Uncharacterised protein [Legionella spiritensis]
MKTFLLSMAVLISAFMMSSCSVTTATYSPGYNSDYVYSVGYYGYKPYWRNRYYWGAGWGNPYGYSNSTTYYGSYFGPGW